MMINWKNDRITRRYIEEHPEMLGDLSNIRPIYLGDAATYCKDWNNPFIYEILRRSGHLDQWKAAKDNKTKAIILEKSCSYHGFRLG